MNYELWTMNNELWTMNHELWTMNPEWSGNYEPIINNEPRTTNNEQPTTNNQQRTTNNDLLCKTNPIYAFFRLKTKILQKNKPKQTQPVVSLSNQFLLWAVRSLKSKYNLTPTNTKLSHKSIMKSQSSWAEYCCVIWICKIKAAKARKISLQQSKNP